MLKKKKIIKNRKISRNLSTIILVIIFIIGLCLLCYPFVSNLWNKGVQSRAINAYKDTANELSTSDMEQYFRDADEFNAQVRKIGSAVAITQPELLDNYENTLDITGTGIMGYISIDKINVNLPIYHGTDNSVLNMGAGHLEGTSLPIGGKGTHCVISAHRGLPSAMLFTDLDKLEEGDTFVITVLNRTLTYRVDKISIVLPDEIEDLYIDENEDYCTLMTCTPYGINTHRLLVRGIRTDNEEDGTLRVTSDAYKIDTWIVATIAGVPIFIIILVWLIVITRKKRRKVSYDETEIDNK